MNSTFIRANIIRNNNFLQVASITISIILVFLLTFSPVSYAVSSHPEWLQNALEKADKLNEKDPNLALAYSQKLLDTQEKALTNEGKAALYSRIATYNLYLGHFNMSQSYIDMFYKLKSNLLSADGVTLLITHATVLESQGQPKEAMVLYLKAKENAEAIENKESLADSYTAIASSLADNLNDEEALKYYHKAYMLTKEFGNELKMAYLNLQMSRSYSYIYDDEKAVQLASEAVNYFHKNDYYYDELLAQNTLADIYIPMKEYDKALAAYQKALELFKHTDTESLIYIVYIGLARTYFIKNENDKARHYFDLYQKYAPESIANSSIIDNLVFSAKIAFADNDILFTEDKMKEAEAILDGLDSQALLSLRINILNFKADIAVYKENFESAYLLQKKAHKLFSSFQNSEREELRSKYKVIFDTDQALLKNQLLEREKELSKVALESSEKQKKLQTSLIIAISLLAFGLLFFIYKQHRNSENLYKLVNTDTLTELANRRYTFKYAERMLLQATKNKQHFSIIVFDIDHFKHINDNYGHSGGDVALKDIASIANEYVRNNDVLGRIGGEEFLVILPNTSVQQAYDVAERIRLAIEIKDFTIDNTKVNISASFGISQLTKNQPNFNQILHAADMALYQAKNSGRNKVSLAS